MQLAQYIQKYGNGILNPKTFFMILIEVHLSIALPTFLSPCQIPKEMLDKYENC